MRGLFISILVLVFISGVYAQVSPALEAELENSSGDVEVLAATEAEVADSNFSRSLEVEVLKDYEMLDAAYIELPAENVENISDRSFIDRLEPNYDTRAMLSDSRPGINADLGREYRYNGSNVSIAVMDSGIANHTYLEVEERIDFTGEGVGDENGHGTHVAGIIGSQHSEYTGIAPGSKIHSVKVLDTEGLGKASQMLRGLDYSLRNDLDVAVLSLGSEVENCDGRDVLSRAVDQASNRMVVVAAAGNQGPEPETLTAPGCSRGALTVGAVDKRDNIASYSSRGLTADDRVKPDVVAPGSNIASLDTQEGFVRRSGTSMAAPHVAGQASLLLSSGMDHGNVKPTVINTSEDLGYSQEVQGAGRVDVADSLNASIESTEQSLTLRERFEAWVSKLWFLN